MTAKTPNTPSDAVDDDTELALSIKEVRDSKDVLVPRNAITRDRFIKVKGESDPSKQITLRDSFSTLATVDSSPGGIWETDLIELTEHKRFSLIAFQDNKPSIPPWDFIQATETPIIKTVIDIEGEIIEGGTTYFTSVTFNGNAYPLHELQAFNNGTPLEKAPVDRDGFFRLTLNNLFIDDDYSIVLKSLSGEEKESEPRSFKVRADIPLSLDTVEDSDGDPVNEGDITFDDTLTIAGKARPDKRIQLLDNGHPQQLPSAPTNDKGEWKTSASVAPGIYRLTAKKLYAGGEETTPPLTFTVLPEVELSLDDVQDSTGTSIPEGNITFDKTLTIQGKARPRERVQLFNNGVAIADATDTAKDDGAWEITHVFSEAAYRLVAKELDTGKESDPPRIFTVLPDIELSLDDVQDSTGTSVPEGGITVDKTLTIQGQARPRERVQLFNNGVAIADATDTAEDDGTWEITFIFSPAAYSLTAKELDTGKESTPPHTFTVRAVVIATLETVTDNNGKLVDRDGITVEKNLNVEGEGEEGQYVEILDGTDSLGAAQVRDGRYKKTIGPLMPNRYSLVARAHYPEGGQSQPYRFTVEQSQAPTNTRVYVGATLIPDNGNTNSTWVTVWGEAEPLTDVKVKINGVVHPELRPTDSKGIWLSVVSRLILGTTYVFSAVRPDNHDAESNTWTITIRATPPGSTND